MKNIIDIRQENQDIYLLSSNAASKDEFNIECAIIVCLYYVEDVAFYLSYLSNIPEEFPIYIYSSNFACLVHAREKLKRDKVWYLEKKNRGRDISTLLVAAKPIVEQYEVICFIHDKSAFAEHLKNDVEYWKRNLWDNLLCSPSYIYNILQKFYENPDLGLLVPPEPYGDYYSDWYGHTWGTSFQLVVELAKRLNIEADISIEKEVYTLSTAFWARTDSLKKLLNYGWSYEDFQEEPLPIDGTISHAIERIIGYVAFDAGYKAGTVMAEKYAAGFLLKVQQDMRTMFSMIAEKEHIFNLHQIRKIEQWKKQLKQYAVDHAKIFIYGSGNYGCAIKKVMEDSSISLEGFVVSPGRRKSGRMEKTDVYELQELNNGDNIGIIVGVSYEYREEIHRILEENKFFDYIDGF